VVGGHVPRGGGARGPGRPHRPPAGRRGRSRLPPRRRLLERRGPGSRRRLPRSRAQPGERRRGGLRHRLPRRRPRRHGPRAPRRLHLGGGVELRGERAPELPRRAPRPALHAEPLGPDRHRHPRPDDDGRGRLRRAHAPPPDPRPLRRRASGPPSGLGARPPRPRRELGHSLRLRPCLHRLVLQLRELGRPAAGRAHRLRRRPGADARDPLRAAGRRGRHPGAARQPRLHHRRFRRPRRLARDLCQHRQLRSCRRARPRLARSERRRPPVRDQRLRRPDPAPSSAATPSSGPRPRPGAPSTG